jgi:membrane associated rhomboid family serine protease
MQPDDLIDLIFSSTQERCAEFALVLTSQAIESHIYWNGSRWALGVAAADAIAARRELQAYAVEAATREQQGYAAAAPRPAGNTWPGIGIYLAVILGMGLLAPNLLLGVDWLAAGRVDGSRSLITEWWRPFTALTLHADAAHLLGNALFGSFFAFSVTRYLGGGFGWLLIVSCGALGNFANAWLGGVEHRSIGASTAVFAALGILSAYCWRRGFPPGSSRRERMAPVVAGIGLLAFTGTGGVNTDIGAHLLGFIAGFGGGLVVARHGFPRAKSLQLACGGLAFGLIAFAWLAAAA